MAVVAPSDATIQSYIPALKQLYLDIVPENVTYKKRPLFALLPKIVTFEGLNSPLPLMYSNPQGVSATFSTAMGAQTPTQMSAFTLTRTPKYGLATLQGEAYLASRSSVGSFLSAFSTEIDNTFLEMTQDIHADLYTDGSGAKSSVQAISGANPYTVTLANPTDVRKFSVGMSIELASSSITPSFTSGVIQSIDRINGILIFNATNAVVPLVNWFIYRLGSRGLGKNVSGLPAWLVPGGANNVPFFGVDRSVDAQRLGSVWLNAVGASVYDAVQTLCYQIDINGGTPDYIFMHPLKMLELVKSLGSNVYYHNIDLEDYANISFKSVVVQTDFGEVRVIPDSMCTPLLYNQYSADLTGSYIGRFPIYAVQLDTFYLMSLDQIPHVIQDDGLFVIRSTTEDAIQIRMRSLSNLGCLAPGYSGVAYI